jgi:hypothetical protein
MAEILDGNTVYSRKLNPVHMAHGLAWEPIEADIKHTLKKLKRGMAEFVYRDVYELKDMNDLRTCTKGIQALLGVQ